jgi:hypothetical protein
MTNYMQGIMQHIKEYFKEFQKEPLRMYKPFESAGKIEIIAFFWPFLLGETLLHHGDSYTNLTS